MKMDNGHLPRTKIPSFDSGFLPLMSGLKIIEDVVTVEEHFRFDYLVGKMWFHSSSFSSFCQDFYCLMYLAMLCLILSFVYLSMLQSEVMGHASMTSRV